MRGAFRQFRRAPGRITASVCALALAVGAIGVLGIPAVTEGAIHEAVERDGVGDLLVSTTPLNSDQLARIEALDNVVSAEGSIDIGVTDDHGDLVRLVGLDIGHQTMDLLQLEAGRLPNGQNEVVTDPSIGAIGEFTVAGNVIYRIVGHGDTLWWSGTDTLFTTLATARSNAADPGTNRLTITASDDGADELRLLADQVRDAIADGDDTFTQFPIYLPDGTTPIDAEIRQISQLIGLLGIAAGLVALVLLASTTNTLITERTREVAVMRALGGRSRQLRRRLRRIALGIAGMAVILGLPLGVLISNLIARMVLEKFVGITPGIAVDWRVLGASAVGTLFGARLVAASAARRIVKLPLADALHDRDGSPFGRRARERFLTRIPTGGLLARLATRASFRRPTRTIAVVAQTAAAVGAAFLIPGLAASVNEFNEATTKPWVWESQTISTDDGLPFEIIAPDADSETGVWVFGEVNDLELDVYGLTPDTRMFDPILTQGSWIEEGQRGVVVSTGFARRQSLDIGEQLTIDLAAGPADYIIVGTVDDFGRAVYLDRSVLATDLGATGMANVLWSSDASPNYTLAAATDTSTAADVASENETGRKAIIAIFGAIGLIVAGVAALAVVASMTVSLYERRHELATLQALGASRRRLRGLVIRELLPVGIVGIAAGVLVGGLGTRGIMAAFEASNQMDIGTVQAFSAIPVIAAVTLVALVILATLAVRSASRRPVAVTLRGAA